MKRILAIAALGTVCLAQYDNATIPFNGNLECNSCIRGGYDYCMFYGKETPESTNIVLQKKECQIFHREAENTFPKPGTFD
jgi:hypothetical protein